MQKIIPKEDQKYFEYAKKFLANQKWGKSRSDRFTGSTEYLHEYIVLELYEYEEEIKNRYKADDISEEEYGGAIMDFLSLIEDYGYVAKFGKAKKEIVYLDLDGYKYWYNITIDEETREKVQYILNREEIKK